MYYHILILLCIIYILSKCINKDLKNDKASYYVKEYHNKVSDANLDDLRTLSLIYIVNKNIL